MTMTDHDPNELKTAGPDVPGDRRDNAGTAETSQPYERPFGDAGNLYKIPRPRPDDPPMRPWWIDDEPHQGGNGPQQNG